MVEYYNMTGIKRYEAPIHMNDDDLEKKYWKELASTQPPIYGCDVASALSDPDLKEWNIPKLGTILDMVNTELDQEW